jgi:hypothetical protein
MNYSDSRRVVFDLHGKMQEWLECQETPLKLAGLHALLRKDSNVELKDTTEIIIDPYGLIFSQSAKKKSVNKYYSPA